MTEIVPQVNYQGNRTILTYNLKSFQSLQAINDQIFGILKKLGPRYQFYELRKNTIIKTQPGDSEMKHPQITISFPEAVSEENIRKWITPE